MGQPGQSVGWLVDLGGFWVKIELKVTKSIKIDTCLPGIVVFSGKKTPEAPPGGSTILAWLGLLGLPCLALAWPGLPLSLARPCQQQQQPARLRRAGRRFAPPLLFLLLPRPGQAKARPSRARPSQGKASQASQVPGFQNLVVVWPTLADVSEFIVHQAKVLYLSAGPQGCP